MRTATGCCAALALALAAMPAQAETVAANPVATTTEAVVVADPAPPQANAGAYDALPPGAQKIARALFTAQIASAATTAAGTPAASWSLDDIAAARGRGGWGLVFKQMRSEGLVTAKNLGEVVSGRAAAAPATVGQTPVVVSYGNSGTTAIVTGGKAHHGASAIITADGGVAGATAAKVPPSPASAHNHAAAAVSATTAAGANHGNAAAKGHGNKLGK